MSTNNDLREALADYAHRAWSGWMEYLFDKGMFNEDGTWTMPEQAAQRWQRQAATSYAELPEAEKASDREEADRMLALVEAAADDAFVLEGPLFFDYEVLRIGDDDVLSSITFKWPDADDGWKSPLGKFRVTVERLE